MLFPVPFPFRRPGPSPRYAIDGGRRVGSVDAEALRVEIVDQNVRELIELTVQRMAHTLRDHRIDVRVPDNLRDVPMDRALIQRVLQHLIENASKFSPPNQPITLSAEIEERRLQVTVDDEGPGIDPDDLPFIFEKYYRGKQQKGSSTGTGMGLAIARAILKAHRGGIVVRSKPGQGARFTFWIPAMPSMNDEPFAGEEAKS